MLTGIKRTKNNDLVINQQGLSVLNILFITSALTARLLYYFYLPLSILFLKFFKKFLFFYISL